VDAELTRELIERHQFGVPRVLAVLTMRGGHRRHAPAKSIIEKPAGIS
jgi:hypothetical protein